MNKTYKFLTALLSLLFLLLIACAEQKTKEPSSKLKTCEEQDTAWATKPYFSEANNGWVYSNEQIKRGKRFFYKITYIDKKRSSICSEYAFEKSNVCANQDTTYEHISYVFYCNSPIKCDTICSKGLVTGFIEDYTSICVNKTYKERISTSVSTYNEANKFTISKEEIPKILKNIWVEIKKVKDLSVKNDKTIKYARFVFDKQHQLCHHETTYFRTNESVPDVVACEKKMGYSVIYTYTESIKK